MYSKRICAGIVTYNPDIIQLENNIQAIGIQVEKLFVCDNGSDNYDAIEEVVANNSKVNISVIRGEKNHGIAWALNQLFIVAERENYDYLLTLDQDTICPPDIIQNMVEHLTSDVGILSPNIIYFNNESFSKHSNKIIEAEWVITSASLTNIKVWREINGFDEFLFIDGVDKDFCKRLRINNYRILQIQSIEILHSLGNLKCKKFFGKTIYVTNHSPIRKYYMARNAIYLDKKYNTLDSPFYIVKLCLKTFFYEDNKIDKLEAIFSGIKNGIKISINYR